MVIYHIDYTKWKTEVLMRSLLVARMAIWPLLAAGCPALFGAGQDLDTTPRTYVLFLDMHEVEALHNVELVVNQAEKHPANPVLPTGDMNDFDFAQASTWAGSIIFD